MFYLCVLACFTQKNKLEEEVSIFLCNLSGKSESLYVCIPTSWPMRCGGIGRCMPKPSLASVSLHDKGGHIYSVILNVIW
jgi:hypothetical protein